MIKLDIYAKELKDIEVGHVGYVTLSLLDFHSRL
jgi:hypothetical protein